MPLFLGVDVGTQGTKAVVYDPATRRVCGFGAVEYGILSEVQGRAEQHPSTWIEGFEAAVKGALQEVDASQIKALSVSGQQHGMVLLGVDGTVLRNAKLWCDVEASAEAAEISKAAGICYPAGFTAPKVMWVKNNEPDTFEKIQHVLLPHDYINYYLTGRMCMECGDASGTGVLDVAGRCWDADAIQRIDPRLGSWLPELIGPNEVVGRLFPKVASSLGLEADVVVGPGGGDNMMSALGAGAVRDGVWAVSLGTSATLFGYSSKPIVDPSGTVAPFCDCTGAWLPLLCIMNCTAVADEAQRASGLSREAVAQLASRLPPGCNGVNFLPYLTGERTPNWPHATGALLGLRPGCLSQPGLIYRAALEGTAFTLLAGINRLKDFGCEVNELRIVGGGSRSNMWCQIFADVFQVPVRRLVEGSETAALGAALQAAAVYQGQTVQDYILNNLPAMQDEVFLPEKGISAAYQEAFDRHVRLGNLLFA
mmetsp:Transcript_15765/g.44116  ORF Transcript_15765/g.44116 Transcript_15765/m.44116 type:complete len:481 (-) Transcript_15765:46-1488(-)